MNRAPAVVLILALCLAGAAVPAISSAALPAFARMQASQADTNLEMPFVKAPVERSGAACVSMLLQFWAGKSPRKLKGSPSVDDIQKELPSAGKQEDNALAMRKYVQGTGLRAVVFRGKWAMLKDQVSKGHPVIVALAAGGEKQPLHFVVVAGIDDDGGYVFVNDPARQSLLRISRDDFEKQWSGAENWALLAFPFPGT
jgi:ABC-type bacteriocin/lantibiotic exporter with double-glycine peptidase domain